MRIQGTKKRFALVATTVAAVLVGGGIAVGYWTTSGSGTGSAPVGDDSGAITFSVSAVDGIEDLYPGASEQFVVVASNSSDGDLTVNDDVTVTRDGFAGGLIVGCDIADFTISGSPIDVGAGLVVPANGSVNVGTATISMANTTDNQDACKNASIDLSFSS